MNPQDSSEAQAPDSSFIVFDVLLRKLRPIFVGTLLASAVVALIVVASQRRWTSELSFAVLSADERQAGLRSLAGQFGVALPGAGETSTQSPEFYADLIASRAILLPIASDSFYVGGLGLRPLSELLEIDEEDSALRTEFTLLSLGDAVRPTIARTTGVVSVRVSMPYPDLAKSVGDSLVSLLNSFNLALRRDRASAERRFTEERIVVQRAAVGAAEGQAVAFLRANREYRNSAELVSQYEKLQREVALQQQVLVGLAQSLEELRIREVRDVPVLSVIEAPNLPVLPDKRSLLLKVGFTMIASFLSLWAVFVWSQMFTNALVAGDVRMMALARAWSAFHPNGSGITPS